jgi:hypothetical protein
MFALDLQAKELYNAIVRELFLDIQAGFVKIDNSYEKKKVKAN